MSEKNNNKNTWRGTGAWEGWSIKNDVLISPSGSQYSPDDIEAKYYTQSDLARLLGVTRGAIADRVRRGTLPPYDKGKTWRYDSIKHLL